MNLPKAIEIGQLNINEAGKKMPPDTLTALKILTEAGRRLLLCRSFGEQHAVERLPNETYDPPPEDYLRRRNR